MGWVSKEQLAQDTQPAALSDELATMGEQLLYLTLQ
jgi:hypothetical protein